MAKDSRYFPHDSNARYDPKIIAMREKFGDVSYFWFFALVERLRDEEEYELKLKQYMYIVLAKEYNIDIELLQEWLEFCINDIELLESDGESLWTKTLKKKMQPFDAKKEAGRKSAEKRWKKGNEQESETSDSSQKPDIPYKEIIDYLNDVTGSKYRHTTKSTVQGINGRWNDGYRLDDFKAVIDKKSKDWKGTQYEKYLTPDTLFRPSKFEKYINEKGTNNNGQFKKGSGKNSKVDTNQFLTD